MGMIIWSLNMGITVDRACQSLFANKIKRRTIRSKDKFSKNEL